MCERLARRITSWEVTDYYTQSDHQAIVYDYSETYRLSPPRVRKRVTWNHRTIERDSFVVMMEGSVHLARNSEDMVGIVMNRVFGACNASMT